MSFNPKRRKFYVNTDKISRNPKPDIEYAKRVVKALRKQGYSAKYVGRGPDVKGHPNKWGKMDEYSVNVHIVGGMCAGTMVDLTAKYFKRMMKGGTVIFGLRVGKPSAIPSALNKKSTDFEHLKWLPRAYDDYFSGGLKGLKYPANHLRRNNAGYVYDCDHTGRNISPEQMAKNLVGNTTGVFNTKYQNNSIRPNWGNSYEVDDSDSAGTTQTFGFDKDNPFQAYIKIVFSINNESKRREAIFDFTSNAPDKNYSFQTDEKVSFEWYSFKEYRLDLVSRLREVMMDTQLENRDYLHEIWLLDYIPIPDSANGESSKFYDKNTDHSSYKMLVSECGFSNYEEISSKSLGLSGQTLMDGIETCMDETDFLYKVQYAPKRYNDKIIFYKDDQYTEPADYNIFKQGVEGNILNVTNIQYSPITTLKNSSICVYKSQEDNHNEESLTYNYTQSCYLDSVLEYGEHTVMTTASDNISDLEAFYRARTNKDFQDNMDISYSIQVAGYTGTELMDYVKTLMSNDYLNSIKRVNSIEITGNVEQRPMIKTTLGLGAIDRAMALSKKLQDDRKRARTEKAEVVGGIGYVDTSKLFE